MAFGTKAGRQKGRKAGKQKAGRQEGRKAPVAGEFRLLHLQLYAQSLVQWKFEKWSINLTISFRTNVIGFVEYYSCSFMAAWCRERCNRMR